MPLSNQDLRKAGLKVTLPRIKILELLENSPVHHLSAEDVYKALLAQGVIEFAVPHTLAFTFFPVWMSSLRGSFGPLKSRLIALNVHDAVLRLIEGGCDLLMAYHHQSQPLQLDAGRYE